MNNRKMGQRSVTTCSQFARPERQAREPGRNRRALCNYYSAGKFQLPRRHWVYAF